MSITEIIVVIISFGILTGFIFWLLGKISDLELEIQFIRDDMESCINQYNEDQKKLNKKLKKEGKKK